MEDRKVSFIPSVHMAREEWITYIKLHEGQILEFFGQYIDLERIVSVGPITVLSKNLRSYMFDVQCQFMLAPITININARDNFYRAAYFANILTNVETVDHTKYGMITPEYATGANDVYKIFVNIWMAYAADKPIVIAFDGEW